MESSFTGLASSVRPTRISDRHKRGRAVFQSGVDASSESKAFVVCSYLPLLHKIAP